MSPAEPGAEGGGDKTGVLLTTLTHMPRHGSVTATLTANTDVRPSKTLGDVDISNGYLHAPLSGPIRPLSPDVLSVLSSIQLDDSITPSNSGRGVRRRLEQFWIRNKGLAFMLLAQVFGTLMNVTTRLLEIEGNNGKGLHPFQILFARMGITLLLATAYMFWHRTPDFPFGVREVRWLLVARGLGGFFGVFGMYYSLLYLPLADAVVITFLAPSLACWACSILIKEPFTRIEQIAGLVSLVGVVLIARPTSLFAAFGIQTETVTPATGQTDANTGNATLPALGADASSYDNVTPTERLNAVGIALIGVLGTAAAFTTMRWIGKRAHPLISVNYFSCGCFVVSVIAQAVLPNVGFLLPASLKDWGLLIFLGTCGFIMQFLLAAGLAYEKSSRATNMTYTQMLFALTFDKLVFGHTPTVMSILGSSLILSSAIIVAIQRDPKRKQKDPVSVATRGDEESRAGLMAGADESEAEEIIEMMPVQEAQLRALR